MKTSSGWLTRHRNFLIFTLLLTTLCASSLTYRQRTEDHETSVSLPLIQPAKASDDPIEAFRRQRDQDIAADLSALQALIDQDKLDDQTRHDAALQLQSLVDAREKQLALESALLSSGIYPCVAVISPGNVTIVTRKETLSEAETALLLTMAQVHAGAEAASVRVITKN